MNHSTIHSKGFFILLLCLIVTTLLLSAWTPAAANRGAGVSDPIPVLSYYYIWFDTRSWDRAKTDYPLLGRYSSSDMDVMRQHVRWAKGAGITGFIVSWKSTHNLNPRLEQLMQVANEENFKLAIIYQGLDFHREPLPIQQVDADLNYFIEQYAGDPAFSIYERPLVIWSGTWKFSRQDIESVVLGKREQLLILASERNVKGYSRLTDLVDGNAYYWSSVNPDTYPGYPEKLAAMGEAVHAHGGLWIAPAAPGFDARLIGGTTIVERKDGQTLQIQISAAMQSSPDAIGLISWNEFSENSHIEPSVNHGRRYLDVLMDIRDVPIPEVPNFDSSESAEPADTGNVEPDDAASSFVDSAGMSRVIALGSIGLFTIVCLFILVRRSIR
ncbi:MAG: hypothetical protein JW730_15575 [Anaerolineales bacterium]|nr:hypothetical protein [Anaerolineales bacterium]